MWGGSTFFQCFLIVGKARSFRVFVIVGKSHYLNVLCLWRSTLSRCFVNGVARYKGKFFRGFVFM